eukprot:TRINITY_DN289_c0_g1_i1.p1 TRINITY_DN289_c0_g1~~TRINITY_DN289_c0_g1_i1.p1  ORF type:complete len:198 (+),score=49.38 TRINITY_DN289_c0_g1_i1:107-700(+)
MSSSASSALPSVSSTSSSSSSSSSSSFSSWTTLTSASSTASSSMDIAKSTKRINKELTDISKSPIAYASAFPAKDNLYIWEVKISGPKDSPFEGGAFKLEMKFPFNYPMKPPEIRFLTRIYHPNVSMKLNGQICEEIISKDWSPTLHVTDVLQRIYSMLSHPNTDSPLEVDIGELFTSNYKKFFETARKWTKQYACD